MLPVKLALGTNPILPAFHAWFWARHLASGKWPRTQALGVTVGSELYPWLKRRARARPVQVTSG